MLRSAEGNVPRSSGSSFLGPHQLHKIMTLFGWFYMWAMRLSIYLSISLYIFIYIFSQLTVPGIFS